MVGPALGQVQGTAPLTGPWAAAGAHGGTVGGDEMLGLAGLMGWFGGQWGGDDMGMGRRVIGRDDGIMGVSEEIG